MNLKDNTWKFATATAVLLIPFIENKIKPIISSAIHLLDERLPDTSLKELRDGVEVPIHSLPIEAALIHFLVSSTLICSSLGVEF